ncbi:MAG: tRNA pseudouridine(55) synthase TruB [Muribaculaceae bacterium]|nr:tRNA pseudouridine(55) synthase TruB [Muribaculaceae bacterium]
MNFIDGEILSIDKPLGWTSFDAVKRLRGVLSRRLGLKKVKVGHAGTLDPMATGVLIVCIGKATKRIDELQAGRKEYIATIRLGATTPSYDLEKQIDALYPYEHITRERVLDVLEHFKGTIMQVPPIFSAVKIGGERAYSLARQGEAPELKAKPLQIDEIELLRYDLPIIKLRIVCSKGTYIRALARDIGEALDSGAHLTALRRTRVGDYDLSRTMNIEDARQLIWECPLEFPQDYPIPTKCIINPKI